MKKTQRLPSRTLRDLSSEEVAKTQRIKTNRSTYSRN